MGVTQSTQHPYLLDTKKGKLQGIEQRDLSEKPILRRFLKIPYAQPPVGQLRWRRPQPLPSDFTFDQNGKPGDYSKFGPICPQPDYNMAAAHVENENAAPEPENPQSEDCLYLNVWVPAGTPPEKGWPVQFYIHGGWLQIGEAMQANEYDPFDLLAHSTPRIIVSPTYRLNIFGFAASSDLASSTPDPFPGNYGLWDQRLALEWTHQNIAMFGGNPDLITVGGLSAGAHSAFVQLYHDTYLPTRQQIIKQIHLYSNALAIQPNSSTSAALGMQFDGLCDALSVSSSLPADDKLARLRAMSWQDLVGVIPKLKYHTFRTSTDGPIEQGGFMPPTFLTSLHDGSFATKLAHHGTRVLLGEVRDEGLLYQMINPPSTYDGLVLQVNNYYPSPVTKALLASPLYDMPKADDPAVTAKRWARLFGEIVADGQVYTPLRGLVKSLLDPPQREGVKAVPGKNVFRYKICWRAKALDDWLKPQVKMCHASDTPIWWASGFRAGYTEDDKQKCKAWIEPFGRFLEGQEEIGWGGEGRPDELRLLDEEGNVHEGWKDDGWEKGLELWNTTWDAQKAELKSRL